MKQVKVTSAAISSGGEKSKKTESLTSHRKLLIKQEMHLNPSKPCTFALPFGDQEPNWFKTYSSESNK